ncbi:unnamed protein product [Cuscuta europaea]|uniref:Uncharacterized protein n=1 Tax=Cuscuta europaea TaxID=41803 RepID=A0A9P1E5K4_CUSEU|nr:unnamed protein product [Cuscuta europaea]
MERYALQKQKDDEALAVAQRRLWEAEEASRVERAAFEKILENAKVLAKAEGRAEAEKAAAESAKKAAEDAEIAKKEAVGEAVAAFVAEVWKVEAQKAWVAAVVEASIEEWVRGPGVMWLAQKGKEYYDGSEYFTQALIYRRLARHLGTDPSAFDPEAYGLPPLQPDTRVPLPEGIDRPDLEDTVLMAECSDEEEDVVGDATSKPADGGDAAVNDDVVIV